MFPLFQSTSSLKHKDFYFLADIYCREVEKLLPVKGTVELWGQHWENGHENGWYNDNKLTTRLIRRCESLTSGTEKGRLILPLHIEDGENIAAVVQDIDPALLKKMAPEWLIEFRSSVQTKLERRREVAVDPATGLYNSQLLKAILNDSSREKSGKTLFLMCAEYKSRRATAHFPNTVLAGRLIDVISSAPVFYLGSNVFCLLQEDLSRQGSLDVAHRLLNRLKREGLHSVHIGISVQESGQANCCEPAAILHECWRAMEAAEHRGPFSLCETTYLKDRESLPLALPPPKVLAILKTKWRGVRQFGLILCSIDNIAKGHARKIRLDKTVAGCLPEDGFFVPVSSLEGYIFAPRCTDRQSLVLAEKVKAKLEKKHASQSVALGICMWPFHDYTKTETTVNCRKALMHGQFFGPGAVTLFDHVSLNVSGDYLFDEGDYRQAVRDYRNGVRIAPDDINLMNSLGVALTSLNRLREAVEYFDRVLKEDSTNFMALVNKGFAQRMLGNNGGALECFKKASQQREFSGSLVFPDLSLQLGRLYCDAGRFDSALDVLENYEKHSGNRTEYSLYRLLGEAYAGNNQAAKAIPALQKAVRKNPHDAKSLSLLGELYAQKEQGDDIALALCQQAVEIDDTSWQHWFRLALVNKKMGRPQEARKAIMESLRRKRGEVEALYLAGQIHRELGEERKARGKFQRVLNIAPQHPGVLKQYITGKRKIRGKV